MSSNSKASSCYVIGKIPRGIRYILSTITGPTAYFNSSNANTLISLVEVNSQRDQLLKWIDYSRVDNLQELIDTLTNQAPDQTVVIEDLALIVSNSHVDYDQMNSLLVAVFKLCRDRRLHIMDKVNNKFIDNLVDDAFHVD